MTESREDSFDAHNLYSCAHPTYKYKEPSFRRRFPFLSVTKISLQTVGITPRCFEQNEFVEL